MHSSSFVGKIFNIYKLRYVIYFEISSLEKKRVYRWLSLMNWWMMGTVAGYLIYSINKQKV